jgi:hypothetical protein
MSRSNDGDYLDGQADDSVARGNVTSPVCGYVPGSVEPCRECPRLISALHRCGILLETLDLTPENQTD